VVNKEVITWSELYKMMESEATDQMKALKEEDRMKIFKDNEPVFLEKLIDMKLQIQEAKNLGYQISPEELKEAIDSIKKKYSMTDSSLVEYLKKEGLTLDEYKSRLTDQMLVSEVVNRQIRNKIVISEEEVNKYIASNSKSLDDSEAFKIRQILFKNPENEADKESVEEKASLIMQKLKSGEDFSSLALQYSEGPSARTGGDLGFVKKSVMAKEFVDVLSAMKPGDYSKPFWTEKGLHIIKLDDWIVPQNKDEDIENIRKKLSEEKFQESYKSYVKNLREKARIEIRL
jgi:peptidyl-prolyl cis-trans isomerase SurA